MSFCHFLKGGTAPELIARARPIPRKNRWDVGGWDLPDGGAVIVGGVQDTWKAKGEWDLGWFQKHLGERRQLVKWQGPIFTTQESLWDSPVWETSLGEYIDYIRALEAVDPDCAEMNAAACPRLYLNGWTAFVQLPWLREYVENPSFLGDITGHLIAESAVLRETFLQCFAGGTPPTTTKERQNANDTQYWELTKLFLSPKGAVTRLHYDNGGAHAWLSQLRGRKLFVCFAPPDGPHLHPFEGDEGFPNGSWLDPLDADALEKWPDCAKATPYLGIVEEGETIVAPQGWWHYAVSLDTSVTVMRNFYTENNRQEHIRRTDKVLEEALAKYVLGTKMKGQPEEAREEAARKLISRVRARMAEGGASGCVPSPAG